MSDELDADMFWIYEERARGRESWWMRRLARQIHEIERVRDRQDPYDFSNPDKHNKWYRLESKRERLAADYVRRARKILGEDTPHS